MLRNLSLSVFAICEWMDPNHISVACEFTHSRKLILHQNIAHYTQICHFFPILVRVLTLDVIPGKVSVANQILMGFDIALNALQP